MYKNGLRYGSCTAIVLLTHTIMLLAVLLRGNYDTPQDILPLTVAVIGLDIVYSIVLHFMYRQMTYTLDFVLLLLVNISVIFQSCFGGVGFAAKHYITCVIALVMCQIGFLLTRNHVWIQSKKLILYGIRIYETGICFDLCDFHSGAAREKENPVFLYFKGNDDPHRCICCDRRSAVVVS